MAKYLLGIDNGGTVSKAALFTTRGKELAVASQKIEMIPGKTGYAEFDAEQLWQAAAASIRKLLKVSKVNPKDIACIACAGHGNGLYLVDEAGKPVRNAIYSSDSRARKYIEQWASDGTAERIRPRTMQAIWPAQPNALLRWLRDNEPKTLRKARWVLMCKDYIRARLTGEIYMELTDMSGSSLMNVALEEYDDEVLKAWDLLDMKHMMPPLKKSADLCGKITAETAKLTGLAAGTPVAGGMFDIDACGLSSGMVDDGPLVMVGGTWGNNQYISRTPIATGDVFMTSCYSMPGYYLMLEGSATSASNLEWFVTQFFQAEREQARKTGKNVYELCNELVAATGPADSGIVFLPFLYGSNVSMDGKACFFGMDGWQTRGHVLRAIYEGVVFAHKWHVEKLLKYRTMPDSIRLTGGAAKSGVWCQIFADIFQVPVMVPDGSELGALGAAICAAVAAGVHPSYEAACKAMVRFTRVHKPNRKLGEVYKSKYARYRKLLDTLAPVWADLAWKA